MAKILVVEDDPDIQMLITIRLRKMGNEVVMASDGAAGLAAAQEHRPDLVLLDWMMPYMTGLEVCEALRAMPIFDRTRIMFLTAKAADDDVTRATAAGADDYMLKPFNPVDLVERVTALLAKERELKERD